MKDFEAFSRDTSRDTTVNKADDAKESKWTFTTTFIYSHSNNPLFI
jgi:hypothetical protein